MKKMLALSFLLFTPVVFAHPGHGTGFEAGLAHPLTGLDHILTMVAVGLWAGQNTGKTRWTIIGTFLFSMLLGGILGVLGIPMLSEIGITASILFAGLLVASTLKSSITEAAMIAGTFALFHGHAHGVEMVGSSFAGYGLGYLMASCLLLCGGVAITKFSKPQVVRLIGGAIACCTAIVIWG